MDTIYLLWYVREWDKEEDTELFIGAYKSETDAAEATMRLKGAPGFSAYPDGFETHAYEIGKDHWTEGFARMVDGKNIFES
jgi:hypothetical protein